MRIIGQEFHLRWSVSGHSYFGLNDGMHVDTISTLNEISARPPAAVGVPNGNGGVMCEYGLDDFI